MQDIGFTCAGSHFLLAYPDELNNPLDLLFRDVQLTPESQNEKVIEILREGSGESYRIISGTRESDLIAGHGPIIEELVTCIQEEISNSPTPGCIVNGAALTFGDKTIVFPARQSAGKSMLAAFLIAQGWRYLTDTCVYALEENTDFDYLRLPLALTTQDWPAISAMLGSRVENHFPGNRKFQAILEPAAVAASDSLTAPALLVFPRFAKGAQLKLEALSAGRTAAELMSCVANPGAERFRQTTALARQLPGLKLTYGGFAQLEHLGTALSYVAEQNLSDAQLTELLASFQPKQTFAAQPTDPAPGQTATAAVPEPTPLGSKKTMTIGMATYDDYDGVYFTVQAIRLYHPEVTEQTEILVIDNHPDGPMAQELKKLEDIVTNYRYFPCSSRSGTAVRDLIFRQANADFVLCLDGHVMIQPGALSRLIDYFKANQPCRDLLQGPMFAENLKSLHTHFETIWNDGMYGRWGIDERAADADGDPFEIAMQGLGLFACSKAAWVGFNPRFRGFGGEEGYIHEKFRQNGGRALCLPFLRWVHRFARPRGVPYRINWNDRIFNYLVGFEELGLDTEPVKEHFTQVLGKQAAASELKHVETEMRSPFFYFEAIYCVVLDSESQRWERMRTRFKALGIDARVRIFKAVATPDNHHVGCALSHRSIIEEARQQGLNNVLVFQDDVLFLDDALEILAGSVAELKQQDWNLYCLGGQPGQSSPLVDGCRHLSLPNKLNCSHALAYNSQVFEQILQAVPDSVEALSDWLQDHQGIDHYYKSIDKQFLAEPSVATQPEMLAAEDELVRRRFSLGEADN